MLQTGAMIGILGGGQLGRMLAAAALRMGYRAHIYTPETGSPAAQVTPDVTIGAYDDAETLRRFAQACDVLSFEFENIPPASLEALQAQCRVLPDPSVLYTCRHRVREKQAVREAGAQTAAFEPVDSPETLREAADRLGFPCVLKTCELGYDGKGQVKITREEELTPAWERLQTGEAILEGWVRFEMELSVIVARDGKGRCRAYPPAQNLHEHHILARSKVPANLPAPVQAEAQDVAMKLAGRLGVIGVLAVEFFVLPGGALLVNELAPRPHNSGHWSIEAAATSQFEQHIRAITGQALGDTALLCPAEMVNLIGAQVEHLDAWRNNPAAHLHLYGKREAREGRKMGHVTLLKP